MRTSSGNNSSSSCPSSLHYESCSCCHFWFWSSFGYFLWNICLNMRQFSEFSRKIFIGFHVALAQIEISGIQTQGIMVVFLFWPQMHGHCRYAYQFLLRCHSCFVYCVGNLRILANLAWNSLLLFTHLGYCFKRHNDYGSCWTVLCSKSRTRSDEAVSLYLI